MNQSKVVLNFNVLNFNVVLNLVEKSYDWNSNESVKCSFEFQFNVKFRRKILCKIT